MQTVNLRLYLTLLYLSARPERERERECVYVCMLYVCVVGVFTRVTKRHHSGCHGYRQQRGYVTY